MILLILVQPECLATIIGHSVKRRVPGLSLNWLDTHWNNAFNLWQCVLKFFRESPLCPYSECRLIQLLIKRPLQFVQKWKKKKMWEKPRVRNEDFYNHHSSIFFTNTSIKNHRETQKTQLVWDITMSWILKCSFILREDNESIAQCSHCPYSDDEV